ncbi:MAG TPA: hypothetical protein VKT72_08980 [Candidatus Baltobacteraceae bacterium]|nr:hypothetical protein [Candidatus Baltobacteraceae bacterium]
MQRSVVAEIFGYLVCLLTVFIFFHSIAGIVNGAFGIAHPAPHILVSRMPGPGPGPGMHGFMWQGHGQMHATTVRAHAFGVAGGLRTLVVSIVLLIASVLVFQRTFTWLNPRANTVV